MSAPPSSPTSAPSYGLAYVPDIDFAVKDPAIIETEVVTDYEIGFRTLTNIAKSLAPGDPVRLHLLTVCHWLSHARTNIDFTGKNNLLKYARGDYLDNLAALHGERLRRLPAQPATTTLRFTLEVALPFDALVPIRTQVQAPNTIVFETVQNAMIPTGELTVDVDAEALTLGTIGNGLLPGQINSILNWNQPFALTVNNLTETQGGSNPEEDEQYRYRIWLGIESYSTCGPRDAYEFWALKAHPDIIQCVVYSAPPIAGEVHLYPLLKGGLIPDQPILDLVLDTCSAATRRPVSDYVSAFQAVPFEYELDITWYMRQRDEVLVSSIQPAIVQAVSNWELWERSYIGRDIIGDELAKLCLAAGAKRIVINKPIPDFQQLAYNQLALLKEGTVPIITFGGFEEE